MHAYKSLCVGDKHISDNNEICKQCIAYRVGLRNPYEGKFLLCTQQILFIIVCSLMLSLFWTDIQFGRYFIQNITNTYIGMVLLQ